MKIIDLKGEIQLIQAGIIANFHINITFKKAGTPLPLFIAFYFRIWYNCRNIMRGANKMNESPNFNQNENEEIKSENVNADVFYIDGLLPYLTEESEGEAE